MTARDGWMPGAYPIAIGGSDDAVTWERIGTEIVTGETWRAFGMTRARSTWTVTHLPTGMAVADFDRKTDAKWFCREVANLIDWTVVTGTERLSDDIRAAVRAAMDRCHAVYRVRFL